MKRQKRLWTAAAVCAVLGAACRAVPGVRFAGLLFWCLTALLIAFAMLEQYKEHAWAKWGKRVLLALVCLGLVAFGYLESLVIRGRARGRRAVRGYFGRGRERHDAVADALVAAAGGA